MKPTDHEIGPAFRREFANSRVWLTRAVVIAAAAVAGLTVVGFTWLTETAFDAFTDMRMQWWWAPLLWTPALTALIVWLTRRFAVGAAGSGIPQVMAALEPALPPEQRGLFVSLRLALAKIVLTSMGLLGGLSLGREGPSVQVAAGVMLAARRLLPKRAPVTAQGLLVAGGAAGIAAAVNTPLAGVMFAIEELSRAPEQRSSGLIVSGIVLAGLIAVSINGNATYFGVIRVVGIDRSLILPGLFVTLVCGVAGGLFARLLIASISGDGPDICSRFRRRRPVMFAAGCGLAVAVIGVTTGGETFGSGYEHTRSMLEGTESATSIYVLLKFVATWLTTWAGVPAGIFAPSLAIGAAVGKDIAELLQYPHAPTLIALGMAAFLAAVTQAPLTSLIIVMEMVDGHQMVLSLMAAALVASAVSRSLTRSLYSSLSQFQLLRAPPLDTPLPAADPAAGAKASSPPGPPT